MSLAKIVHRSRQRLETNYYTTSTITPLCIVAGVLIFLSLFVLSSETTFRCTKTVGPPSLNDVCTYQSTSSIARSSIVRAVLPTFLTGTKYYYPLEHLRGATVIEHTHHDSETNQTTYTYDLVLVQSDIVYSDEEQTRLANFIASSNNIHGSEYYPTTTIENFLFESSSSRYEQERLARRIDKIIEQYHAHPNHPISEVFEFESWIDEVLLIIGVIIIIICLFFVPISEEVKLDESTKTLLLIRSAWCRILITEYIPISQIVSFQVDTSIVRGSSNTPHYYHRRNRTYTVQHDQDRIQYKAVLIVKQLENNGAFVSVEQTQQQHHADHNARIGIGPVSTPPSPQQQQEQQQEQQQQPISPQFPQQSHNGEYSNEVGEDGELVLMNRRVPQQPPPPPPASPPPSSTTTTNPSSSSDNNNPQTRSISLLCGHSFAEGNQGAVTEYVALFKDWVNDFQRREALQATQRDEIIHLAERALQRQALQGSTSTSSSSTHSNNNSSNEEVPTAPLAEETTELTDEQINFLIRRRNARLINSASNDVHFGDGSPNTNQDDNTINNDPTIPVSPSSTTTHTIAPASNLVCCVCLDDEQPVRTVLMPCKHLILCSSCSAACDKCPLCRREIAYTMEVFF